MSIAFVFAIITIIFKPTTMAYQVQCKEPLLPKIGAVEGVTDSGITCSEGFGIANHYLLIYWLLLIYLCLQMLDEMIELFSVMNQLEKGALGLFFEMNYLVGVILSIYISWFIFSYEKPELPPMLMDGETKLYKFDDSKFPKFNKFFTIVYYDKTEGMPNRE